MPLDSSDLPFVTRTWHSPGPFEAVTVTFDGEYDNESPGETVATVSAFAEGGRRELGGIVAFTDDQNNPTVTCISPDFDDGSTRHLYLVVGDMNLVSASAMADMVAKCRQTDSTGMVIAVPIWSTRDEFAGEDQRLFAVAANRAGAALVVGLGTLHRHPVDLIAGRLRLHGLGAPSAADYALKLEVRVTSQEVEARVEPESIRISQRQGEDAENADLSNFYLSVLETTKDSAAILHAGIPYQTGKRCGILFTIGPRGRVPVNRKKFGSLTTTTVWDEEPEVIRVPRKSLQSSVLLTRAFQRLGTVPDTSLPGFFTGESSEGLPFLLKNARSQFSSEAAARETDRKEIAREVLEHAGIEVAAGKFFASRAAFEEAAELLARVKAVVVKPVDGRVGQGVTVGVTDLEELAIAWERAFDLTESGILVEQQFHGDEVRIFVVDGTTCAVAQRIPPLVVGDGTSTIRELLNEKNAARHHDFALQSKPVELTPDRIRKLRAAELSPLSVLPVGETYVVDHIGNVKAGAEPADVTDTIHPSYTLIAERAVAAFPGMHAVGVDVIATDLTEPARTGNHIVIELNGNPDISLHASASFGRARDVAAHVAASALTPRSNKPRKSRRKHFGSVRASTSEELLAAEFSVRNYAVRWTGQRSFHAIADDAAYGVWGSVTNRTGSAAYAATQNPSAVDWLLRRAGLATPDGRNFSRRESEAALAFAAEQQMVDVVAGGIRPIAVDPSHPDAFADAWSIASQHAKLSGIRIAQRHPGRRFRCLVAHGRTLAVVPYDDTHDSRTHLHSSYRALAAAAAKAVPGLDLAEVTLVVDAPRIAARRGNVIVETVRAEPDLPTFATRGTQRSRDVIRTLVDLHLGAGRPVAEAPFTWSDGTVTPARRLARGVKQRLLLITASLSPASR